jgi:hypothetical protein
MPLPRKFSMVSIICFIDRASRSSFPTMSLSPLRVRGRHAKPGGQ